MLVVRQEISKEKAERIFTSENKTGISKLFRKPISLARVEIIYIPYYSFDLTLEKSGHEQHVRIAIDALLGNTTFFVSDSLQFDDRLLQNVCDFILKAEAARGKALEEYKGHLLEFGLRNKKATVVNDVRDVDSFYYPFWIGYFQKNSGYDFRALDAVSGEFQGMKMRKVLLSAFRIMDSG